MKKGIILVLFIALVSSFVFANGAQETAAFPSKEIKLICPFGAGGGTDALARKLAEIVKNQNDGVSIVVENKTGGSGAVGMGAGAVAKPDGYTVTMTTVEVILLPCAELAPFEPTDFTGIIRVNFDPAALIVSADNPANSLQEFVDNSKASDKAVNLNVSAFPTNYWLCGALLKSESGANLNLIEEPNGAAQEIANLLGKHVDGIVCTMAEVAQYVASGDFKILAVASGERNENFPNVPTFKESGFNVEVGTWRGFMVPKATPADVVAKLGEMFTKAYESDEFQSFLTKMGFGDGFLNPEDFAKLVEDQTAQYKPVIAQYI